MFWRIFLRSRRRRHDVVGFNVNRRVGIQIGDGDSKGGRGDWEDDSLIDMVGWMVWGDGGGVIYMSRC